MQSPDYRWLYTIDNQSVTIRTLMSEDQESEAAFVRNRSDESRYFRFHGALRELTPEMLRRFSHMEYPLQMALIATIPDGQSEREIGVARYATNQMDKPAEIAVAVADDWQGRGIGTRLLTHLRNTAVNAGIQDLYASVLANNHRMLALARHLGFNYQTGSGNFRTRQLGKFIRKEQNKN